MAFKFQDTIVYEQVLAFTKDIYDLTGKLPVYEQTGLITALRQLASSMLTDLASGHTRASHMDLHASIHSCIEKVAKIAALVDLCYNLGYLTKPSHSRWLLSCEDLTKRLYEQLKSSK